MSLLKKLFGGGSTAASAPQLFDPRRGWPRSARELVAGTAFAAYVLECPGRVDVVGEGKYQAAIGSIAGGKGQHGPLVRDHQALLLPEPWNQYDPNAVRVFLVNEGNTVTDVVGYLSREDAVAYRAVIDRIAAAGRITAAKAELTGGWDRGNGDTGSYGVILAMGNPEACNAELDRVPVEDIAQVAMG